MPGGRNLCTKEAPGRSKLGRVYAIQNKAEGNAFIAREDKHLNSPTTGKNLMSSLRGLLYPQSEKPSSQEEGLSAWVPGGQIDETTLAVKGFLREVVIIRHQRQNVRGQFKQLELLLKRAAPLISELTVLLNKSTLPLSISAREIATAVDSLLKAFALSYYELAETLDGKWFRVLHARQTPLAALRAAQLIHWRALLAYQVYSNGSPQRWKQYHALLAMTEKPGKDAGEEDKTLSSAMESLAKIIVQSSLLTLSDPTSLKEEDIGHVRFYIERYGHLASLSKNLPPSVDSQTPGIFVLSDNPRGPQRLKPEYGDLSKCHILDTRPLIQKLKQQIQWLKEGRSPTNLGLPSVANTPAYQLLLMQCEEQWSFTRKRRHPRSGVRPRADLVSGFDMVHHFVAQKALTRRRSDDIRPNEALSVSEWSIVDQSEGGFGLRFIKGNAGSISVGEIVALCFKDHASLAICVTRRARCISDTEFEIGLELLAERALATNISIRENKDAEPLERTPAILIPRMPNAHNVPGLLLPPHRSSKAGIEVSVVSNGKTLRLAAAESLEYFSSCELVAMKPMLHQ